MAKEKIQRDLYHVISRKRVKSRSETWTEPWCKYWLFFPLRSRWLRKKYSLKKDKIQRAKKNYKRINWHINWRRSQEHHLVLRFLKPPLKDWQIFLTFLSLSKIIQSFQMLIPALIFLRFRRCALQDRFPFCTDWTVLSDWYYLDLGAHAYIPHCSKKWKNGLRSGLCLYAADGLKVMPVLHISTAAWLKSP